MLWFVLLYIDTERLAKVDGPAQHCKEDSSIVGMQRDRMGTPNSDGKYKKKSWVSREIMIKRENIAYYSM